MNLDDIHNGSRVLIDANILKRRLDLGLFQREAAAKIGVDKTSILNWETRGIKPEVQYHGSEPLSEDEYRALTQPLPADRMLERPVSRYVSNSRNEGPACHATPDAEPPELALG